MHSRDLLRQRTFREIMFLQELNDHDNIIRRANGGGEGAARVARLRPRQPACEQPLSAWRSARQLRRTILSRERACSRRCRSLRVAPLVGDERLFAPPAQAAQRAQG